jgi:O-acetylhomoserine/O-acetylserine sulfhydrylase
MQLTAFTLLLPFLSSLASSARSPAQTSSSSSSTTVTLRIPPSHLLPNPHTLPASTRATFTTLGKALAAPLSVANTFVFRNVTPGSYLVDVHCATHAFVPLRVDVLRAVDTGDVDAAADVDGNSRGGLRVAAWETYRGNDWGNKGEVIPVTAAAGPGEEGVVLDARAAGEKGYFMERSQCAFLSHIFVLDRPCLGKVVFLGEWGSLC